MTTSTTQSPPKSDPAARRMELVISYLLRAGVIASAVIIVFGVVVMFARHPVYLTSPTELDRLVSPGAAFPHALADLWAMLSEFHGRAIMTLGLLVLIATPVLRVAASVVLFAIQRDWTYTLITAIVLTLLLLSLTLGASG
jgi:uncharacterized membrane protein